MTFVVTFKVEGKPEGKGRPRFARRGNFVTTYTDNKTKTYENKIRDIAMVAMGASKPLMTPLEAFIYISYPVPASYSKSRTKDCLEGLERPTKKPDIDNVIKAFLDSMNGIIYVDDTQVVELHSTKVYGEPYVEVMIKEIT
jgi:Holliday junction resolvase RusA-like endonuclease